jgi:hypothetical protein
MPEESPPQITPENWTEVLLGLKKKSASHKKSPSDSASSGSG